MLYRDGAVAFVQRPSVGWGNMTDGPESNVCEDDLGYANEFWHIVERKHGS